MDAPAEQRSPSFLVEADGRRKRTVRAMVIVQRGAEQLQDELTALARNEAGRMGGNTIVPESVIDEGQQSFGVYSCP